MYAGTWCPADAFSSRLFSPIRFGLGTGRPDALACGLLGTATALLTGLTVLLSLLALNGAGLGLEGVLTSAWAVGVTYNAHAYLC